MVNKTQFIQKISSNDFVVGIIGLGYVGLPLAVSFSWEGIKTLGFDTEEDRVTKVNEGKSYISDVKEEALNVVVNSNKLIATSDFKNIKDCDALFICVPTPLDKFQKPDMSYIENACMEVGQNMKEGTFISLESTTYPTTTEEFVLPILERESQLKQGEDFWLAYSPERIDPGNQEYQTKNTPKVLGAFTDEGLEIGKAIYSKIIDKIHAVSSPRVAEMVKILENTYRLVNISLINELALLAGKMDINIWEVIEAAKTKPYGFEAFYPGPGIGGHCIPFDPFYLEFVARRYNFDLSMIHAAGHINMRMPHYVYIKIASALNRQKKAVNGSNILFLGVAYKSNVNDERESPALKIMDTLAFKGGIVSYHDPYISEIKTPDGLSFISQELSADILINSDCVVLATNHSYFKIEFIQEHASLIVDLRNMIEDGSDKVYKL